jgi:all-trans-retinol 13,14-reductase
MTPTGIPYKRATLAEHYDSIVIGSGAGGLTAAALLARHGSHRVLVLERHYTAGGFTHVFRRPGFEWDVGVHYVGDVHRRGSAVWTIFDHLTEGRLEWSPMPEVYDRVRIAGTEHRFVAGRERFREQIREYFPSQTRGIDRYLDVLRRAGRWSSLYFAEKVVPPAVSTLFGGIMRAPFARYSARTTSDVLHDLGIGRDLAALLAAQWGDYGLPPGQSSFGMHAILASHYLEGGAYPLGGAGRIVSAIAPVIEREGGAILVSAEVSGVDLDAQGRATGVRLADGRSIRAGAVISDAGARNTFGRLLPPELPATARLRRDLEKIPASCAHFCLYVGLNGSAAELGLEGANLWVHPTPDHDANVARFAEHPAADFPFVYISFPSAKDPTFEQRFPGRSTIDVITLAPYDWFTRWQATRWQKRGDEYEAFKAAIAARLLDILHTHVPVTRGRVAHAELGTPLSTRHFANHPQGEIYGLAHTPRRFLTRSLRPRTPVPNLYLTGQDVSVCGVMGAVSGGILAASAVLRRNMFSVVTRPRTEGATETA